MPYLYFFPPLWRFPFHVIGRLAFQEARDYHAMRDLLAVVAMKRKGAVADVQHGIVGEHKHSSIVAVPVYFLRRACEAEAALYPSVNCFLSLAPWTPLDGGRHVRLCCELALLQTLGRVFTFIIFEWCANTNGLFNFLFMLFFMSGVWGGHRPRLSRRSRAPSHRISARLAQAI